MDEKPKRATGAELFVAGRPLFVRTRKSRARPDSLGPARRKRLRDAFGKPVSASLRDIFHGREEFGQCCAALETIRQRLLWISQASYGRYVDMKHVNRLLHGVNAHLRAAMPMQECRCSGETWCERCEQQHWQSGLSSVRADVDLKTPEDA